MPELTIRVERIDTVFVVAVEGEAGEFIANREFDSAEEAGEFIGDTIEEELFSAN